MIRKQLTDLLPLLLSHAFGYGLATLFGVSLGLGFSLFSVFLFHFFYSALVLVLIPIVKSKPNWAANLGYYYLGSLLVKFLLFTVFFPAVVSAENIPGKEALLMLLPLFISLLCEVLFLKGELEKMNV